MRKSKLADRLYHKRYYAAHRDKYRLRQQRWQTKNRAEHLRRCKQSYQNKKQHRIQAKKEMDIL